MVELDIRTPISWLYTLRLGVLQLFLPIWGAFLHCDGFTLVYTKTFMNFLLSLSCNISSSYLIYKLMVDISLSWIALQLICKLNCNVILSEPCARENHSHLMSSERMFIGSQGIQCSLLPFKLGSIIFIKGYELLHVLGEINP